MWYSLAWEQNKTCLLISCYGTSFLKFFRLKCIIKQLLDAVFVICKIITLASTLKFCISQKPHSIIDGFQSIYFTAYTTTEGNRLLCVNFSPYKGPVIIYTQGWGRRKNGWVAKKIMT